ncbi:MAG: rhomboid family intramembrane serine protease [Acidimicrobiales bacterium]
MLPLKDYNPTRRFPIITVLLIAANVVVFFFIQRPQDPETGEDVKFTFRYAAIPCEVVEGRPLVEPEVARTLDGDAEACVRGAPDDPSQEVFPEKSVWLAILSSMFLHGGWLHLGGNMLFLWIFGNNIEDRMSPVPYIAFYLLSGLAAAAAHIAVQPDSTIPVVGASGAVAGVMGAYLVLFPNVKIRTLFLFLLVLIRDISAKWLLGFWFILQFFTSPNAGVAWVAHVGGFIFGALVALIFRAKLRPSRVDPVDPAPAF